MQVSGLVVLRHTRGFLLGLLTPLYCWAGGGSITVSAPVFKPGETGWHRAITITPPYSSEQGDDAFFGTTIISETVLRKQDDAEATTSSDEQERPFFLQVLKKHDCTYSVDQTNPHIYDVRIFHNNKAIMRLHYQLVNGILRIDVNSGLLVPGQSEQLIFNEEAIDRNTRLRDQLSPDNRKEHFIANTEDLDSILTVLTSENAQPLLQDNLQTLSIYDIKKRDTLPWFEPQAALLTSGSPLEKPVYLVDPDAALALLTATFAQLVAPPDRKPSLAGISEPGKQPVIEAPSDKPRARVDDFLAELLVRKVVMEGGEGGASTGEDQPPNVAVLKKTGDAFKLDLDMVNVRHHILVRTMLDSLHDFDIGSIPSEDVVYVVHVLSTYIKRDFKGELPFKSGADIDADKLIEFLKLLHLNMKITMETYKSFLDFLPAMLHIILKDTPEDHAKFFPTDGDAGHPALASHKALKTIDWPSAREKPYVAEQFSSWFSSDSDSDSNSSGKTEKTKKPRKKQKLSAVKAFKRRAQQQTKQTEDIKRLKEELDRLNQEAETLRKQARDKDQEARTDQKHPEHQGENLALQEKLNSKERQLAALSTRLSEKHRELEKAEEALKKSDAERASERSEKNSASKKRGKWEKKATDADKDLMQKTKALHATQARLEHLQQKHDELDAQIEKAKNQIKGYKWERQLSITDASTLEETVNALLNEIDHLRNAEFQMKIEYKMEIEGLKRELAEQPHQKHEIKHLKENIDRIEREHGCIVHQLEVSIGKLEAEAKVIKDSLKRSTCSEGNLSKANKNLRDQLSKTEEDLYAERESSYKKLNSALDNHKAQLDKAENDWKERLRNEEKHFARLRAEKGELDRKIQAMEALESASKEAADSISSTLQSQLKAAKEKS